MMEKVSQRLAANNQVTVLASEICNILHEDYPSNKTIITNFSCLSELSTSLDWTESIARVLDAVRCAYTVEMCNPVRQTELLNKVYKLQSVITESLNQDQSLFNIEVDNLISLRLLITILQTASSGDTVDPRFSLPMWKLFSSVLQRSKNEIKRQYESEKDFTLLDQVLSALLTSSRLYYAQCSCQSNLVDRSTNKNMGNGLRMLNLLCRVATFSVKEFGAPEVLANPKNSCPGLSEWIAWIISIRYHGGYYASGYGLPNELAANLETSLFLSLEMLLGHLVTFPVANSLGFTCSVAAVFLKQADLTSIQRLRVYGLILSQLPKYPQCYSRWIVDDFNLYEVFINTCMQLPRENFQESPPQGNVLSCLAHELYMELLHQLCASTCGLPGECFPYLERSILMGLLGNHTWTSLFCADAWCFLVRYGSGDLCWQYATLFASCICLLSRRCSSERESHTISRFSILSRLDRLGRLLARFLVFLTPKQQVQFLNKYALSDLGESESESHAALLWRFVPLPIQRLQKAARSLAEKQVEERLKDLTKLIDSQRGVHPLQLSIETASTLRLLHTFPEEWRRENAVEISKLFRISLNIPSEMNLIVCPPCLSTAIYRPLSTSYAFLASWTTYSDSQSSMTAKCSPSLLEVLTHTSLMSGPADSLSSPLRCFLALRAWHFWLCISGDHLFSTNTNTAWLKELDTHVASLPLSTLSSYCQPLLASIKKNIAKRIQVTSAMDVDCPNSDESLHQTISAFTTTLTVLEAALDANKHLCSRNIELIHNLSSRFNRIVEKLPPPHY